MGGFTTGEAARERFRELLDQVDSAHAEMRELSSDEVGNDFRVEVAERLETQERTNRGLMYRMFGEITDPPDEVGLIPVLVDRLWARLRIPRKEIKRRMKLAGRIRARRQLTGAPLPPELAVVAQAVESGTIGEDHLRSICRAIDVLPSCVSEVDRGDVEASLVREAAKNDAEFVTIVGRRIDEIFNPDGHFDEADRARRRGLLLGAQGPDGMSRLSGWVDPETRCYVEAVTAAVRPGRHLPDGALAEVADERSAAQRCHDGIKLGLKVWDRLRPDGRPPWPSGDGDRADHVGRPQSGRPRRHRPRRSDAAAGAHRRADRAADARCDQDGRRRYPLPGGVRQPHRTTTPTSYCAATPTHPTIPRSELAMER